MQEREPLKIARYIKGLARHIASQVDVSHYITCEDVCKLAQRLENRSKEQQKPNLGGGYKAGSSGTYKGNSFLNTYETHFFHVWRREQGLFSN